MATKSKAAVSSKAVVKKKIVAEPVEVKAKVKVRRIVDDEEEDEAPAPKKSAGRRDDGMQVVTKSKKTKEEPGAMDYLNLLEDVAKVVKLNSVSLSEESRMHSGLLGLDLILGRGIGPTMLTVFGPEQSAKTTLAITVMAATINQGVPISTLWDAEQSSGSSSDYIQNILNEQGIKRPFEEVFGVRKKGVWTTKPLVYYQDSAIGEDFFNWLHALLKRLPDKRFENDRWWYVYENTKVNIAKYGPHSDKIMSRANHGIWLPAKDDSLQAVIILDSYPSLMPLAQDNDEHTKAMAVQARMFSLQLPRVKGSFRAKRIALVGINQLRLNPMAMFGSPETEPGGQALKFFCFTGDTLLLTDKGLMTGEEYYHAPAKKLLGESGFEKPTVYDKMGYSQTLTLYTKRLNKVSGKPGHRVKTLRPHKMAFDFVSLEELQSAKKTSTYVAAKVGGAPTKDFSAKLAFKSLAAGSVKFCPTGASSRAILPTEMGTDLCWLLGVLMGDGHVRNGTIQLASTDKHVYTRFRKVLLNEFGISCSVSTRTHQAYSKVVSEFLNYLGAGSKSSWQKSVPWSVRHSGRAQWLAFLAGLFDSDFSASSSTLTYMSVSSTLVNQVRTMAQALGYPATSGNLKEAWWAHGANGRLEHQDSELGHAGIIEKHVTRLPSLNWFGTTARDFMIELTPFVANAKRFNKFTEGNGETHTPLWRVLPTEKFDKASSATGNDVRLALKLYERVTKRRVDSMDCWDDSWLPEAYDLAATLRTSNERSKAVSGLDKVAVVIRYSKENSVYWDKAEVVESVMEKSMTYDGNMPKTHTIVTSGIVSHNSDQRIRVYPRALSGVPFHPKGDGLEKEPSVDGNGEDSYRYVHGKTIKNKLSVPQQEMWFRLWVSDATGEARGYDLVWDTFYTCFLCGVITGKRSSMRLNIPGLGEAKRNIDWLQFKKLIIGSAEQRAEICAILGYKTMNLRRGLINLSKKGTLDALYWENKQVKGKAKSDENDDDDDDADDDAE